MKTYEFNLKHDGGKITVRISATDLASAHAQILKLENAPASSIQWWRVVPTPKQIKKTKSLLRGI